MTRRLLFFILIFALCLAIPLAAKAAPNDVIVLCYHDIPKKVNLDEYGVDRETFVQQIEYLRSHGYHFVGVDEITKASQGKKDLPDKTVLLTFDDAYLSFYEFVYPLLKLYGYPCVLAVVTKWIDTPEPDIKQPLMNWKQIGEVSDSGLVEVASHTHKLHYAAIYNPQGNTAWAAASRRYFAATNSYENDAQFRERIRNDLGASRRKLFTMLGKYPKVLVWPYGQYNQLGLEEAKRLGFVACFTLEDKIANAKDIYQLPRYILMQNPSMEEFIAALKKNFTQEVKLRVVQADLDLIYDEDAVVQEKNLDEFIERIYSLKPNAVYLQAFCDEAGSGNISSVYFPNRVLPMKADLFNRVVNQLAIRGIQVFAWMPMLSIVLPDKGENEMLRVKEFKDGKVQPSTSWYARLSPFHPETLKKMQMLYADMAANARIAGVVFLDDGYLNDFEDFNAAARPQYAEIAGNIDLPPQELSAEQALRWARLKTKKLMELGEGLKEAVRRYRPNALFSRTLYAEVVMEPDSQTWYAQNFQDSLNAYDYVNIMAYPRMEKIKHPKRWFASLVDKVKKQPLGLEKTIFKVQTYDWDEKEGIATKTVYRWLRRLISLGAQHIGYYPDNFTEDEPEAKIIRLIMSCEDFPFKRRMFVRDSVVMQ